MATPTIQNNFRVRKSFSKIPKVIDIPNLIDIQKHSFDKFLQIDVPPEKREDSGLQGVFSDVFPIRDFNETSSLEFVSYHLEKPKYDVDECHQRGRWWCAWSSGTRTRRPGRSRSATSRSRRSTSARSR
jgi:DNA-directed RNA polymerase subunit beta